MGKNRWLNQREDGPASISAETTPPPAPEQPRVEFHTPKPVHSWRELLTEIGAVGGMVKAIPDFSGGAR